MSVSLALSRRPPKGPPCTKGHPTPPDHLDALPCPWPECSPNSGNTATSPGVAEFVLDDVVRDGEVVGHRIGTFWRQATGDGWRWSLVGTRDRLHPAGRPPESGRDGGSTGDSSG